MKHAYFAFTLYSSGTVTQPIPDTGTWQHFIALLLSFSDAASTLDFHCVKLQKEYVYIG